MEPTGEEKYAVAVVNEDLEALKQEYDSGNMAFSSDLVGEVMASGNFAMMNFVADRFPRYADDMYNDAWENFIGDPERYRNLLRWARSRGWRKYPELHNLVKDSLVGSDVEFLKILGEEGIIVPIVTSDSQLTATGVLRRAYFDRAFPVPRYGGTGRPKLPTNLHTSCSGRLPPKFKIPVSRYEGLYYGLEPRSDKQNEGTFYFYEPEGEWHLLADRVLVCGNKVHAAYTLEKNLGIRDEDTKVYKILGSMEPILFYSKILRSPAEATASIKSTYQKRVVRMNDFYIAGGKYIGADYFGNFDDLDQLICRLAREAGYELVLLQREPGETRIVTEILDVRDRQVSAQNICITDTVGKARAEYPEIWFP